MVPCTVGNVGCILHLSVSTSCFYWFICINKYITEHGVKALLSLFSTDEFKIGQNDCLEVRYTTHSYSLIILGKDNLFVFTLLFNLTFLFMFPEIFLQRFSNGTYKHFRNGFGTLIVPRHSQDWVCNILSATFLLEQLLERLIAKSFRNAFFQSGIISFDCISRHTKSSWQETTQYRYI